MRRARRLGSSLLGKTRSKAAERRRPLRLESLEGRLMLAGDVLGVDGGGEPAIHQFVPMEAEGEPAPDLVAFAQALNNAGVKFFGAAWCPHCTAQKELFEDGASYLPFIEVTNPDKSLNQTGIDEGIGVFPTWRFQDNSELEGQLTLAEISAASGIAIPQGESPSIVPLDDVDVLGGSPLQVPLNGYDPDGQPITYTVTSDDPLVQPTILQVDKSLQIRVNSYGQMNFGLFDQFVPRVTDAIEALGANNTLDNTPFHRIADLTGIGGTIIQGGANSAPQVDDQFHPDLQHNTFGLASYAKSSDDTNAGQFFLLGGGPTRHLDGNHSIFALLTEGDKVLEELAKVPRTGSSPDSPLTIEDFSVVANNEDGILMLKAAEGASGTANITVTATDADGNSVSETFLATVSPDSVNTLPFMNDIPELSTSGSNPISVDLTAVDVEGDPIQFAVFPTDNLTVTLPNSPVTPVGQTATASLTIVPDAGFTGTQTVTFFVHEPGTQIDTSVLSPADISSVADVQTVTVTVSAGTVTGLDLLAASDTGISDSDNVTSQTQLQIEVTGATVGATVQVFDGTTVVGSQVASDSTVIITTSTLSDGVHLLSAGQTVGGAGSDRTDPVTVTVDSTAATFQSTAPTTASLGTEYVYDAATDEEGSPGFTYEVVAAPTGTTINPATGEIRWTPVASQLGVQSFEINAVDQAGNSTPHLFNVNVTGDVLAQFRFNVVDSSGATITQATVGDVVTLQVFIQDPRGFDATGVFAAYLDVLFQNNLLSVDADPQFATTYSVARNFDLNTAGLIDEVGAASGSLTPLGGDELLLFEVDVRADIAGTEMIVGEAADDPVVHDMLVYNSDDPVPVSQVDYGNLSFEVTLAFGANGDIFNFDEDSVDVFLDVLGNDQAPSGGQLTVIAVGTPNNGGTVTVNNDGSGLIYSPAPNFNGSETFTYQVQDDQGSGTSTATVVVQVQPINDDPTAVADSFTVDVGTVDELLDVIQNDVFAPDTNETLRVIEVSGATQGTARLGPGGSHVLYTPNSNASGTDTFTYTISDGNGGTATASVIVTLNDQPDDGNPTASNDSFTFAEDSADNSLDVLTNDVPNANGGQTLTITNVTGITDGGTVTIAPDGLSLNYTPAADFVGFESFSYTISDGDGGTDTALVTVELTNTNDAPTAVDDQLTAVKDSAGQLLSVLGNDTDPDPGDTLTIKSVSQGSNGGTLSVSSDGLSVVYTPAAGFSGSETFTYVATDGEADSNEATATITVQDFAPSSLGGSAYIDTNHNGVFEPTELPLGGVTITLTGTDLQGNAVNLTQKTSVIGAYLFTNLAPGTYTLTGVQPEFLIDGHDTIGTQGGTASNDQFTIPLAENTRGLGNDFGELGREAATISLLDFLSSTNHDGVTTAINQNQQMLWVASPPNWRNYTEVEVSPAFGGSFNLVVADSTGAEQNALIQSPTQARILNLSGLNTLIQVNGAHTDFGLTTPAPPVANTVANNTSGNGASSGTDNGGGTSGGSGGGSGEGEGEGSRSQVLILPPAFSSFTPIDSIIGSTTLSTTSPLQVELAAPAPSTANRPASVAGGNLFDAIDTSGGGGQAVEDEGIPGEDESTEDDDGDNDDRSKNEDNSDTLWHDYTDAVDRVLAAWAV